MDQKSDALRRSEAEKAAAFDSMVSTALTHLPHVLENKYNGLLRADDRDMMCDMLICDGILGGNAKSLAYALKYGLYLTRRQQREAFDIVNAAIRQAREQHIVIEAPGVGKGAVELRLDVTPASTILIKDLQEEIFSDYLEPDDEYPLSNFPRHQLVQWGL